MLLLDIQTAISTDPVLAALHAKEAADKAALAKIGPQIAPPTNQWWNTHDAMTMCSVILAFGIVVVLVAAYLIRNETNSQLVLRVLATILILTFSVFLIVAGYNDQQIAPAIGLLGTVAGYLLGKETNPIPPKA